MDGLIMLVKLIMLAVFSIALTLIVLSGLRADSRTQNIDMKYITSLTGLEIFAYHGLYPEERAMGALFLVDVSIEREVSQPIHSIEEATNYEILLQTVKAEMAKPTDLIETVAQLILDALKESFPQATSLSVTIHKPNPAGVFKSGVASVTLSA
jgi:7,8-dihydroneopterin aldolase/epimerase/oxygenase